MIDQFVSFGLIYRPAGRSVIDRCGTRAARALTGLENHIVTQSLFNLGLDLETVKGRFEGER
jgi:hypothetical protein